MSLSKIIKKIFPDGNIKKHPSGSIDVVDGDCKPAFKKDSSIRFEPGTFGKVSAVKLNQTGEMCALKKIWFTDPIMLKTIFREIEIMSKLSGDSVVRFFGAWMEKDEFIFILMELCKDDLKHVLARKPQAFGREPGFPITSTEFYVSWHILAEIVHGVNYLHHLEPPVIHRDLKPANVLITDGLNGGIVKLCDFGLAKTHEHSSHTTAQGTKKYMAPEVKMGRHYNVKADVFSIAVIALEVFGLVFGKIKDERGWINYFNSQPARIYDGSVLDNKMKMLLNILYNCITVSHDNYNQRPSCDEFLNKLDECSIDKHSLTNTSVNDELLNIIFEK